MKKQKYSTKTFVFWINPFFAGVFLAIGYIYGTYLMSPFTSKKNPQNLLATPPSSSKGFLDRLQTTNLQKSKNSLKSPLRLKPDKELPSKKKNSNTQKSNSYASHKKINKVDNFNASDFYNEVIRSLPDP